MKQFKQVIVSILFLGMLFSSALYSTDVNDNGGCNDTGYISCNTDEDENTTLTPPMTDDKLNPSILNTLGAVNILNLSGKDAQGVAVNNFMIKSLPDATQGILYREDGSTAVVAEENLTKEEADGLRFDPNESFVGDATFTYVAVDDQGLIGNEATVTMPVIAPAIVPIPIVDTNQSDSCVCEDYNASIPVFSTMGLMIMALLSMLMGVIFMSKEFEQTYK